MATNQSIWGENTKWTCPVSGMTGSNQDMKPLVGYLGPAPSKTYPAGCLFSGIYNDKFPTIDGNMFTNAPIDDSISYCGLGNESVWSRVQYYMCGPNTTGSLTASDDRSVTNFAFCESNGTASGLYQNNNSNANQKRGNRDRWAPMGYNLKELNPTAVNTNSNRGVQPYVQLPVRNMVLTATLRVAKKLTENKGSTTGMDIANVPLWDYMDTSKQKNYTTHPYILAISIQPYMVGTNSADNIDPVTGVPPAASYRSSFNIYSGLTMLSPLSYANGVESDAGKPGNILHDVYSYYWSKSPSRITGIWIFGASSVGTNDFDYIRQLSTDEVKGQLLWALPHKYATMRSMEQTNDYGWYYLEYYDNGGDDNLVHWIMEQMACFGLFFTIDKETAMRGALNDEKMCLGVLEDGIGHGKWVSGEENLEQEQWSWDTTNSSSYKPLPPGPEPFPPAPSDDDEYTWNTRGTKGVNAYRNAYAATKLQIDGFHEYINKFLNINLRTKYGHNMPVVDGAGNSVNIFIPDRDYMQAMKDYIASITTASNPGMCVVDLIMYPFRFTDYGVPTGSEEDIKFGIDSAKYRPVEDNFGLLQAAIQAKPLTGNTIAQLDLGTTTITPKYNDFRDYKPYTTCEVTIPYHGTVPIDTADFMGYELGVIINVDVNSGLSTAYITKNGVPRLSIPGSMGIHVPLTAINSNDYFNQLSSRGADIANTKIDQVTGIISGVQKTLSGGAQLVGNIAGAAGGNTSGLGNLASMGAGFGPVGMAAGVGANIFKDFSGVMKTSNTLKAMEEQLEHLQVNPAQITSYTSELGFYEMQRCRITYHRCIMNSKYNKDKYGKTVGFATNETGQIKNFTGYAKFSNAILNNGSMLEEEKAMILDKLESGVIIVKKKS